MCLLILTLSVLTVLNELHTMFKDQPNCDPMMGKNATKKKRPLFKRAYVEHKISHDVASYAIEENAPHREVLKRATKKFRDVIELSFPGTKVFATGSYACGVDVKSSDLDFTLQFKGPDGEKDKRRPIEKLAMLRNAFRDYQRRNYRTITLISGRNSLLKLRDEVNHVEIDVTTDNDTSKRNTAILRWYGQIDDRFPSLCKAVKEWAAISGVENSRNGRLNSFSICLMLINYLQVGVSPPVLPCLQKELPELNGEIKMENDDYESWGIKEKLEAKGIKMGLNKDTLGALLVGFFEYYGNFDFKNKWISVRRGQVLDKYVKEDERMEGCPEVCQQVTVEDPFLRRPWNCAGTLWCNDVMNRFQNEFKMFGEQIKKFGTIFIDRPSLNRMRLLREGVARDLQKKLWSEERIAAIKCDPDDDVWGTWESLPEELKKESYQMYSGAHPREFWDDWHISRFNQSTIPKKLDAPEPWVVLTRVFDNPDPFYEY